MAECASSGSISSALIASGYSLFLAALPLSTSPQGSFLSPLSILYALSLALNGAGPGSSTQAELLRAIAAPGTSSMQQSSLSEDQVNAELSRAMALLNGQCPAAAGDGSGSGDGGAGDIGPSSEMILANSVWAARGTQLKADYVEKMRTLFQATARVAAHGAKDVNDWVAGVTHGMIKDLVQTDNFDAVLANALYFKGLWEKAFEKALTQPAAFTTANGASKQVDMMQQEFSSLTGARKDGVYDAVVLPYKGGSFSAVALLPAPGVEVAAALRDWAQAPQELAPVGRLRVKLPKFKVSSRMSLTPVLEALGVEAAFGRSADFSRLAEGSLFVSDVVHEAVVDVGEEGTVAAAATGVMMRNSLPLPPPELVFDRPFAFVIRHNPTGLPAFAGVVNDPGAH